MTGSNGVVAGRRARLQAVAAAQREILALHWRGVQPALQLADRGLALARGAARHPLLVVAGATALLLWRPRRRLRWVRAAVLAWQLLRRWGAIPWDNK